MAQAVPLPAMPSARLHGHRLKEPFLKGPIPWAWIDRAGRLPGQALKVGLVLWQKAGYTGKGTIRICLARMRSLGLSEASARRGIKNLEKAGLIKIQRKPGRGLLVTLLNVVVDANAKPDEDHEG